MFHGWEVNGCQQQYYIVLSMEEVNKDDNQKVDRQCKRERGNNENTIQQVMTSVQYRKTVLNTIGQTS